MFDRYDDDLLPLDEEPIRENRHSLAADGHWLHEEEIDDENLGIDIDDIDIFTM